MMKAYGISIIEILESLAKAEEMCISVSFYFSKIYDIEDSFDRRSKYAYIAKQIVFLSIQGAKHLVSEAAKLIRLMNENDIAGAKQIESSVASLVVFIEDTEDAYMHASYVHACQV